MPTITPRQPREGANHEGLDRPGSLHRRRSLRGDRPRRVHAARRRARLREGGRQGLRRRPRATRRAPRAWPRSPTASSTPSSSPPRSAPASASSSRPDCAPSRFVPSARTLDDDGAPRGAIRRARRRRPTASSAPRSRRGATGEEAGVGHHAVVGPHRLALDVPGRGAAPRACGPSIHAVDAERLARSGSACMMRRRVRAPGSPPGAQRVLGVRAPPATARAGRARPGRGPARRCRRSSRAARRDSGRGRPRPRNDAHVGAGPVGEVLPQLVPDDRRRRRAASSSTARPTRRRSRTPACPGPMSASMQDRRRGPSGRSPARPGASRARSPRASGAAPCTARLRCAVTTVPSGSPMTLVVGDEAGVGVELAALLQRDEVAATLRVDEHDALARGQHHAVNLHRVAVASAPSPTSRGWCGS